MRNLIIAVFVLLSAHSILAQKTKVFTLNIFFDTDKSMLKETERQKIDHLFDTLDFDRIKSISLYGHTDSRADSTYNMQLSARRTQSVQSYLNTTEVPVRKLSLGYFGENKPVTENETDLGKQKNRRVEMRIVYLMLQPVIVKKIDTVKIDTCDIRMTLTLSSGININIDKCNYKKIKDCMKIKTLDNPGDILATELSMNDTRGNDLISDGMFKLDWNSQCSESKNFEAEWLLTEEEMKRTGFGFYTYDSLSNSWEDMRKRVKKVVRNGKTYYRILLSKNDLGKWMNKDKRRGTTGNGVSKVKVKGEWKLLRVESEANSSGFYIKKYNATEIIDDYRKWKLKVLKTDVFVITDKKGKDTLKIPFHDLVPSKHKLFSKRLAVSYGKGRTWPHLGSTMPIVAYTNARTNRSYYRKYKIKRKTIRELLKLKDE